MEKPPTTNAQGGYLFVSLALIRGINHGLNYIYLAMLGIF